ncbi:TniB family NTP-binding protein [Limnoraphis robusta Tam1]|uniref:TniB family NTP-binding protein n=1 Tax=Limnoraphis robusta TaxID=1118279 RepID=UPI002B1F0EB3|nr:TniB family NTP-binding protein [Limnoraphis robusta]MEA5499174.1 TniB family NTP-binding protein [Limnoraphis robusta BA-68 BA1]MEA5540705.1 TniB family NTP-binding protein [Limnoraphis robusta Tam1]
MADDLRKWIENLWGDEPLTAETQKELERLISPQVIELDHIEKIHSWLNDLRLMKQCGRIIAPSRTGKSVTCDIYRLLNRPQKRLGRRDIIPVLYTQVPGDCQSGELLSLLLEELGYDETSGNVTQLRRRLQRLLKESKVEMIIIDEANFLNLKTLSEIARIHDICRISMVLTGTDELDNLIKKKEYIHRRFVECYRLKALTENQFPKVVQMWEDDIVKLPVPSNLTKPETLRRLYEKTGGTIGLLDRVLRRAAILSLKKGNSKIDRETLDEVLVRYE